MFIATFSIITAFFVTATYLSEGKPDIPLSTLIGFSLSILVSIG